MSVKEEHKALIYIMVLMSAADSDMTDKELFTIGEIVKTLPAFDGFDIDSLPDTAENCAEILAKDSGLDDVLAFVSQTLPARLHETAYALACDIAAVEGRLRSEEIKLLEFLRHHLEIGRLPAAAIERGAKARYQKV